MSNVANLPRSEAEEAAFAGWTLFEFLNVRTEQFFGDVLQRDDPHAMIPIPDEHVSTFHNTPITALQPHTIQPQCRMSRCDPQCCPMLPTTIRIAPRTTLTLPNPVRILISHVQMRLPNEAQRNWDSLHLACCACSSLRHMPDAPVAPAQCVQVPWPFRSTLG